MKIIYSIEDSSVPQDSYSKVKAEIVHCKFAIDDDLESLKTLLDINSRRAQYEDTYYNLRLWISALNKIDETLNTLLKWLFRLDDVNGRSGGDLWCKSLVLKSSEHKLFKKVYRLTKSILIWTSKLLSHSFNKSIYNSVEHLVSILKLTSYDELADLALQALTSLSASPPNHRNVFVYSHTTVMHKNPEYTLPLFDILLAGSNLPTFNVKDIVDRVSADDSAVSSSNETDLSTQQRSKWWFQRMQLSMSGGGDQKDPWFWYRCYLRAFLIAVRTHRDLSDVGSFYSHKAQIQHDFVYLLRSTTQHWADQSKGIESIPSDVRQLGLQCVSALLERSENHFTNAQKDGEWSGAVRLIPPFDSILQGQLGIDGGQIQGLAPSLLKHELHWLTTLPLTLGVEEIGFSEGKERERVLSRLEHLEGVLLIVLTSLPLPKAIQAYINNGVIDSMLAVMRIHGLSDLNAMVRNHRNRNKKGDVNSDFRFRYQYQMYCLASLQVQVLDMIISSKRGAMEAFYAANGPVLAMERLRFEAALADSAAVEQYVHRQSDNHFVEFEDSPLPMCYQSLVLSLTALLDSLLNNHNNREVRSGSHASLNQMDLIRSTLFGETVVSMCDGIASVSSAILATLVRMLCELINNDNATPAVINLFLLQSPYHIIRKAYEAVSSVHIRHDMDTMASILNLITGLCIKEEGVHLINAVNPFQVVLGIFKDAHYLLPESLLMHQNFAVQIGSPCGELLRSNPSLSPLFAQTFLGIMRDVVKMATDFAQAEDSRQGGDEGKSLGQADYERSSGRLSNVILGNMMIAVLTCFENVVERSKDFAKDFLALEGGQVLYSFLSNMFGTRRHLMTTLGVKAVVTTEDRAGNNQVRRTLKHSYMKLMTHQAEGVFLDVSSRIQNETDQLVTHLAAFRLTFNASEPIQEEAVEINEDEEDETAMTASPDKVSSTSSSSKREKNKKKGGKPLSIQQLRAMGKKKAALKVNKEIAAASLAGATSALKRSSADLHLHSLLDAVTDSTADMFAFDYTLNDEFFAVLYSLLRAEALFDLLASLVEFSLSLPNNTTHKYLPVILPALASAALVNVNCVSEIGRAHDAIVSRNLDRDESSASDSDVNFDLYVIPGKLKMRLRDNIVESKQSYKSTAVVDGNSFLFASERICSEESKSLTYFRLRDGANFIRKREVDGAPNVEIIGIHPKTAEEKSTSKAVYRRDQSISMYRMGKNVLRAVCNAFNDLVGVVPTCCKGETDAVQLKADMELLKPALFDMTFKKILGWGFPSNGGSSSACEFSVQKYLQFKYAVDICGSFLSLQGSMHEQQANNNSQQLSGNPLSFASLYQHDKGVLFEQFVRSCCVIINGCYPSVSASDKDERLQTQERVFCMSITAKILTFLKNILHCLGAADTPFGRDVNTKHGYPRPNEIKYNCFITLYEHFKTVWAHPLLYTLPSHMSLSVVELMAHFQECGHRVYLACVHNSDDAILGPQIAYLESLGESVKEDSVRLFLGLAQYGGMHFEEKHSSFCPPGVASRADLSVASKLWPLNVLAAEDGMKRSEFLRQLVEIHIKGQVMQITVTHKPYKCSTSLEHDIRNIDKGVCVAIEKQYKVATSALTLLFCHLATGLQDVDSSAMETDSSSSSVDYHAIEGLLGAINVILYVSGALFTNICPPYQNALMLLFTTIPEFSAVFADVAALLSKETGGMSIGETRSTSALQQPQFRWVMPALLFLDTAVQPFLTSAPLLSYCEMLSKNIAAAVKSYHSSFIQQFDCSARFSDAADEGTIEVLLQTTPIQHFFSGNKKVSCSLGELMAAAEDSNTVNATYVTPMAQLRASIGISVVQSCVRIIEEESTHASTATKLSPLLMQSALQVVSHLARDTTVAQEILKPDIFRTFLNVGVGFDRLSLYLSSVVQTAIEQASGEALMRTKMQRALLGATEMILESDMQSGCSEQRLKFKFAKHIGKFMSVVECLMMRDANALLSVITDPALYTQIHNPVKYIPFPDDNEEESNDWRAVLRSVNQSFMTRIDQLQRVATGQTLTEEIQVGDARCLLGDIFVCIADLLHSLLPEQAHYMLSSLVTADGISLQNLLLDHLLPHHAVTVNATTQAIETTLEWSKKRNNTGGSRKDASSLALVASSKLYSSGIYLLVSVASLEGAVRCQLLTEVSKRIKGTLQLATVSTKERSVSEVRAVVCLLDLLNALDVPHYNPALSGLTFIVPADSILAALSAANVHIDLMALQDAVNASGGQSPLTQSLTTAVNLLMLRGVSAANEVARFVVICKEQLVKNSAADEVSSSSNAETERPFWSDDMYIYTNVFAVARRANNYADKKKAKNAKLTAGNGGVTISATSRNGDVRGFFNGVMTAFQDLNEDEDDEDGDDNEDNSHRVGLHRGLPPPPQAVESASNTGSHGTEEQTGNEGGDEGSDGDELDHYSDLDEDEEDGYGHDGDEEDQEGFSDDEDENDFIDDEDDEGGGMGMGGAHGMWQQIGGMHGGMQHFQNWAGGGENDRGDHSDISMDSDDEGMHGMHDEDDDEEMDEFDMMSAPPDSDDDDDSELNEGGSHNGDDCTVEGSMIFIDDNDEGGAGPVEADQEGNYMTLAAHIKLDNDIYHMIGYLSYNDALEPRSLFDNMLGPLLGDKKDVHFGRTDFRHLAQATGQGRVGLGCPQASRRAWNTDIDFVNALLNSVVLMPFFSYLVLQEEYRSYASTQDPAWKDSTNSVESLALLLKALGVSATDEKNSSGDPCLAYNYRAMNRKVRAATDATAFGGHSSVNFMLASLATEITPFESIGSSVVDSFVSSVRRYGQQMVAANFNRHLNMKSMSLFKLCLATSRVVRNYQMSLIFLYSSMDRTKDWDQALFAQLTALLSIEENTGEEQEEGMSYSDRLVLAFEMLSYQCDEMYRNAERIQLGLRHALLTAPPPSATTETVESPTDDLSATESSVEALVSSSSSKDSVAVMAVEQEAIAPRESVLGLMLDALHVAVERGVSSSTIKDLLRILSHLLTLCEKESSSASIKVNETFALRLFVPVVKVETLGSLCGLFLRDDLFVSSEHYLAHFSRLMNFLCQNKTNWLSLVACSKPIGETLMAAVAVDTQRMLKAAREQITLPVEDSTSSLDSPSKASRSASILPAPLISSTEQSTDSTESSMDEAVVLVAKPARQTVQFHSPNAELRLVHFFDLLQSTTKGMNLCGVVFAKGGGKGASATETPLLNGTKEDMQSLNGALIHLQESVVWDDLIKIMRLLNKLIMSDGDAAAASEIIKPSKLSAYGSIAAEHLRMVPLIESLFQVATLPTVLFNHVAPLVSDKQHAVFDATKTASKTPMIFRDVSLSVSKAKSREGAAKQTIRLFDCYVTSKLFTLVEENKKLLNTKLNQNIRLLELSLQAMRTVPELSKFLDFSVKRKYLRLQIKRLRRPMRFRDMTEEQRIAEDANDSEDENDEEQGGGMEEDDADNVSVMVDRDDVLNQSFHCVQNYSPRQFLRGSFHVTFNNEPGMDAGGLTREWLLLLTRSIFKPAYALFSLSGDGVTYQPNPHSGANPEHLDYFKFIGRLVAKAICDNQLLDVHFTRSFYKHILRVPISFSDLEAFDKEYFKSLNALLQHSLDDLGLELTFTATANVFGTEVRSDLVEDGENVAVTDENKAEYVRLIAHHCLTTSFQKQIDAFLDGFHELLPHSLFSHFDPSELELLISGLPEVDIEDLHAHTSYTGYKQSDAVIQRFWSVLRKFSNEEKALFVQFVTGTSKVPLDGFQSLQGSEGVQMFGIHKAYDPKLLPTAHTCFNQLDLPEYPSEEIMRDKLVLAIRECSEGFGFQ